MSQKSPAQLLLRILEAGEEVEDAPYFFCMVDGVIYWRYPSEPDTWRPDKDIPFTYIIRMAERIGRDELWLKCCAISLREMKQRDRNKASQSANEFVRDLVEESNNECKPNSNSSTK